MDFSHLPADQRPGQPVTPPAAEAPPQVQPAESVAAAESGPASPLPPGYEFITEPKKPGRKLWQLPTGGSNSLAMRAAILSGGLLVLVILLIVVKNLVAGGTNFLPFVAVAQDQQELVHLTNDTTTGAESQALSAADQNVAATINLSVNSAQTSLTTYLTNNKYKISTKQINLKVSASLDAQLTSAQASGDYDQVFQQIIQAQFNTYANDLQQAYKSAGPNGKALLKSDYNQLQLLVKQLSAATNSNGTS